LATKKPVVFKSGGDRSHVSPRFDLIPREFLECLADRLALGLKQYGDRGILSRYRNGDLNQKRAILEDKEWWIEMSNHLQDHVISLRDGEFSVDDLWGHVGAIMWNAGMIAWAYRKKFPV
jgi:hypothetical protein